MGLPEGWVTDLDLSRTAMLKLLGNGVVPQQALLALGLLDALRPVRALRATESAEQDAGHV